MAPKEIIASMSNFSGSIYRLLRTSDITIAFLLGCWGTAESGRLGGGGKLKTPTFKPLQMTSTNKLTFALNERRTTKGRVRQNLIRAATSLFLGFSISPSVSRNFANCLEVETNFTSSCKHNQFSLLIFNNSPAGYTSRAFINLKRFCNIGFENWAYMWFYTWFRFSFWRNITWRMLKIAFPRLKLLWGSMPPDPSRSSHLRRSLMWTSP